MQPPSPHEPAPVAPLPDLSAHRVAITGAAGFLGQHVIRLLHRHGARIIALRRPDSAPLHDESIQQEPIDFGSEEACATTLHDLQPTALIHLAGYANTDRSIASIAQALQINVGASINLILGAMDKAPDCRIILPGSFEHASPWREPLKLGSPYGMSKAMVEVLSG
ncbi:MAG: NAD-dependent epimerase/dehydratase family protein, partial [Lautropia sp.]|nr:NAD-dependent epimerase/dehydratase family protein [Lautropia sp.]